MIRYAYCVISERIAHTEKKIQRDLTCFSLLIVPFFLLYFRCVTIAVLLRSQHIGIKRFGGIDGESVVQFILYPLNSSYGAILVEYKILYSIYVILDDDLYAHG